MLETLATISRRLEQVYKDLDIELEYGILPPGNLGLSLDGTVKIRETLSDSEKISVGVHELAHELLHKGVKRQETTKNSRETEAEAVAFVVCESLGLDTMTRSADYLTLYDGSTEQLAQSLDAIQKTAKAILDHMQSVDVDARRPSLVALLGIIRRRLPASILSTPSSMVVRLRVLGRSPRDKVARLLFVRTVIASTDTSANTRKRKRKLYQTRKRNPFTELAGADYEERREARIERFQDRAAQSTVSKRDSRPREANGFGYSLRPADPCRASQ